MVVDGYLDMSKGHVSICPIDFQKREADWAAEICIEILICIVLGDNFRLIMLVWLECQLVDILKINSCRFLLICLPFCPCCSIKSPGDF